MMGRQPGGQEQLFSSFNLDDCVPADHLLRGADQFLDLSELYQHLAPWDERADEYRCPQRHVLRGQRRAFKGPRSHVTRPTAAARAEWRSRRISSGGNRAEPATNGEVGVPGRTGNSERGELNRRRTPSPSQETARSITGSRPAEQSRQSRITQTLCFAPE